MKEKKKKEKIVYIDDGRSLADMSNVSGGMHMSKKHSYSNPKAVWQTYWNATKMMLLPTLIAVGFLAAVFLIAWIVFGLM